MDQKTAEEIAHLLNAQNQLAREYTARMILEHEDSYIVELNGQGDVIGVAEVKRVQWYQAEISHVSVHPEHRRQGIAQRLLTRAEAKAQAFGAHVTQSTIRAGNTASESLFTKNGYQRTVTFHYAATGNNVGVYQKSLSHERTGQEF